ncbi:uncharacterized protein LAESUDRAFT_656488 [Laetiporus sulphureus 93-53]|uniref:P-loop containing nucleoside triphosphate hydrolase protein n=1 Tax=Laetiporus sulphureus 93-53 TaxID=1314785 RepID=A0A165DJT2_9APHY|nr:uncharacterized protein LAESUDRAFT_656488 [Laetiporus sulphureus 93-53]KZT05039.1 hypothetical protein LAESUDRAFT_656488 [Laetiporus sulphureus 93-53]
MDVCDLAFVLHSLPSRIAEFVTRSIDNSSHGVDVQSAMQKLQLRGKKDLLPGMEVRLLPHQIIGVAWMLDQEHSSPHKGGILAISDRMSGKTVQMIATMAMNLPDEDESNRSTLIVVPAALLLQWKDEITSKTNGMFTVHIHHGRDKLKSTSAIAHKDVIIATYHTLNHDFALPADIEEGEEMRWLMDNGGVLARTKWFRVILDESQFIRNRATRSSQAVAMLRSRYRWCLTGTPITNTLADIYGLLRFGRFRPWNDWKDFNEYIAKVQLEDAPLAGLRAQEVLKPLMLRRTKNAEIEGEPILQLPEKHVDLVELDFSDEERKLYDNFERRAQIQISRFIRDNTIVMILRLRQLCCHPNLILGLAEEFSDPTMLVGSNADRELARATKQYGGRWVTEIKQRRVFMARAKVNSLDFDDESDEPEPTCPVCGDLFMNDSGRLLGCGHEICAECLDVLATSNIEHNGEFGNADEQTNLRVEKEFEAAVAKGLRPCPTCKKMMDLRPANVFRSSAFEPSDEELRSAKRRAQNARHRAAGRSDAETSVPCRQQIEEIVDLSSSSEEDLPDVSQLLSAAASTSPSSQAKRKEKSKKTVDNTEGSDAVDDEIMGKKRAQQNGNPRATRSDPEGPWEMSDALIATWKRSDDNMEPSTKMLALIECLKEWEASGDKIIVFSQWTSMLDLIETLFSRYGIRSLRYDGKMSRGAREEVLMQFRKPGGLKVALISTKCGGVGLNLVSANRIVNMDLGWNYASESQAYDRVHRLGQDKEVFVKRLVVRDTIEQRMLKLQETKVGLAEAALGEGTGIKLHKLSVKELKDVCYSSFAASCGADLMFQ